MRVVARRSSCYVPLAAKVDEIEVDLELVAVAAGTEDVWCGQFREIGVLPTVDLR